MVAICTVNVADATVEPLITMCPVTELVRPTATFFWPTSTSFTRYPTTDPAPTRQFPETGAKPEPELAEGCGAPVGELGVLGCELRESGAGAGPSMKWM